jgi:hypothetical protein
MVTELDRLAYSFYLKVAGLLTIDDFIYYRKEYKCFYDKAMQYKRKEKLKKIL